MFLFSSLVVFFLNLVCFVLLVFLCFGGFFLGGGCFCIHQDIFLLDLFWKITCCLAWDWKSEIYFYRSNESLSWVFSISLPNVVKNLEATRSNKHIFFPVSIFFFSPLRVSELWKTLTRSQSMVFFPLKRYDKQI